MEFNLSNILTLAFTLTNSASSDSSTITNTSQEVTFESADSRFNDDAAGKMGRTTSDDLNSVDSSTDFAADSLTPHKLWSAETMLPSNFESAADSLYEMLLDIKKNVLEMEFEEIISSSVQKDLCDKAKNEMRSRSEMASEALNLHLATDNDTEKKGADNNERHSLLLKNMLVGNVHENATFSAVTLHNNQATCDGLITDAIALDHSYARPFDKPQDGCSNSHSPFGKTENSNQSAICNKQKLGIQEHAFASCMDFSKNYMGFKPLSPASSTSSLTADLASNSSYSVLSGDESDDMLMETGSPLSPPPDMAYTNSPSTLSHKHEKYKARAVTPLELSSHKQHRFLNHRNGTHSKLISKGTTTELHDTNDPMHSDSVMPISHSSGFDQDISETDSETMDGMPETRRPLSTSQVYASKVTEQLRSVFHDHDYCSKVPKHVRFDGGSRKLKSFNDVGMFKDAKRKYTKRNKISELHEKILKAKYLKKELLKKDSSLKPVLSHKPTLTSPAITKINSKYVGRQRKRMINKNVQDIDPEIEKKMKITGQFQDQYVYYLSKSSRTSSRGRQGTVSSLTSDKNPAPVPNLGDIVIPHLTDADIEAVRLTGRAALNQPVRPHSTSASSHPVPYQSVSSFSDHSVEHMADVDSHIVSTILSMESDSVSYPSSPQAADAIGTSSLNPNQPALTESLRLMSGDPTITSEHVLSYLLSLVKDDGFTDSECVPGAGASGFLPPLSSDSTMVDHEGNSGAAVWGDANTMVDHEGNSGAAMWGDANIVHSSSSGGELQITSSDNQKLHSGHHNDPDHCFHLPQSDCVTDASLLDDLSLMLESKEVLFPPENLHADSDNLVMKTLKPDLSSVEIPHVASSPDRLRSIEKTIDYLYRKDDVFDHTQAESSLMTTPFPDDTPWIVTVTLYLNDMPAIMINNQPYIRLVDIYKQILPAKDTGILKKRCQLLKIPLLNCTEMQRHFLVQYGRACNSKSTVIVSLNHASDLIAYYASPQSRAGRSSHDQKIHTNRNDLFHTQSSGSRHGSKESKKTSGSQSVSVSVDPGKPQCIEEDTVNYCETSTVKQKRNKKANDLGVLKDNKKEKSSESTIIKESVVKTTSSQTCDKHSLKMSGKTKLRHHSKDVGRKRCSHVHQKKSKKIRHIHKVDRKHNKKDANGDMRMKLSSIYSETDSRSSPGLSQSKTCQTEKCKVKKPLDKCKHKKGSSHHKRNLSSISSTTSPTTSGSLRTLPVKHQAAVSDNDVESQLPPQAADLYLDLFTRRGSACVRCATCCQYLPVSHFMRHHHVPNDSGLLAAEPAQRILVPQNSLNMSKQEQRLWRKFQRLQKAFGSAGDEIDHEYNKSVEYHSQNRKALRKQSSSLLHLDQTLQYVDNNKKKQTSSRVSSVSCHMECDESPASSGLRHKSLSAGSSSVSSSQKHLSEARSELVARDITHASHIPADSANSKLSHLRSGKVIDTVSSARTSTRKRKSKQLFSIENY